MYKTMVKRFRQNKAVWLSYGSFLLQQGHSDAATTLLERALSSLPSKESKMADPDSALIDLKDLKSNRCLNASCCLASFQALTSSLNLLS